MRLNFNNVGKGLEAWGDAYKERNKRDELDAIKVESEKATGYTDEQAKYLHEMAKNKEAAFRYENGQYVVDTPGQAGLAPVSSTVRPTDVYDTGRYKVAGAAYDSQDEATNASRGLMAGVYRKYGDDNMARQLDADAYARAKDAKNEARQSRIDDSTLKSHGLQQTAAQLQIDAQRLEAQDKQRWVDFETKRAALPDPTDKRQIADLARITLTSKQQIELAADTLKVSKGALEQLAIDVQTKVKKAGNLEGLAKIFKDDPELDPGSYFDYATDPKTGKVVVQFKGTDGKPQSAPMQFASTQEAYSALAASASDIGQLYTWMEQKQNRELERRKTEAAINASNANAAESTAKAGLAGRTDPNLRSGGGAADYIKALLPQIRAERVQANTMFDTAIQNANGDPAKVKAAQTQYAEKLREIDDYYGQYGGRSPAAEPFVAPPEPPAPEAAKKTVVPVKGTEKKPAGEQYRENMQGLGKRVRDELIPGIGRFLNSVPDSK